MSSVDLMNSLASKVDFVPVDGSPNSFMILLKEPAAASPRKSSMTDEDWDKFERDVMEARDFFGKCSL